MAPGTPVVNIGDASVTEGHTGTRSASLTVTLSPASSQPVTVSYSTANGSATAGSDYQASTGTVTFDAGQTTKTISVLVNGDRAGELDETFLRETPRWGVSRGVGRSLLLGVCVGSLVSDYSDIHTQSCARTQLKFFIIPSYPQSAP